VVYPLVGWRGMFMVGALPALLVLYIRRNVPESPDWLARQAAPSPSIGSVLRQNVRLSIYAIILMTAFNFFHPRHPGHLSEHVLGRAARLQPRHHHNDRADL
jgi:MFS family permease